jgi:hypothetical protein
MSLQSAARTAHIQERPLAAFAVLAIAVAVVVGLYWLYKTVVGQVSYPTV